MHPSPACIRQRQTNFSSCCCRTIAPPRRPPRWGAHLLLTAALALGGCGAPMYEQAHDSLSALSSVLGVVASAVPGASAVGLAGQSLSAATTLTGAASPGAPSSASARQGRETIYDGAYGVRGYFEYQGETVWVFDRDGHSLGYADTTGTYDHTGQRISPNAVPGLLLGKS